MIKPFEETEEVREAVANLWTAFGEFDRGDLILWSDIEQIIKLKHDNNEGSHIINKWRTQMLRTRSIATRAKAGVGLRLLTNEEQTVECAEDRQRRAHRQCNRALNEVGAVDGSSLGIHLRRLQNATIHSLKVARKQIRRGVKEVVKATATHPLRKE